MSENIDIKKPPMPKTKFNKVFESGRHFFEWATKTVFFLGIAVFVFAFCTVFYQEYNRNAYTVQEFVVPKYFEESGLNGEVLGRKIIDELKQLKQKASSEQDDEAGFETVENDETAAEITLGGTGLSISQLVEIAKALLHKPTRKITGELVLLDSVLLLTLRATGENAITIEQPFRDSNLLNSLDTLLEKAGEKVARILMPLTLGIYYQNTYREKQAIELLEHCVLALPHEDDKYACIHLADLLFAEKDTAGAIAKIEKALQIDENFSDAYITWAKLLQNMKDSTAAVQKYQAAIEVEEENTRIYKSWGRFLGSKKDSIGAVKQFMKGLAINPNDSETYAEWAYFLRFHRKKYIESIEKYKTAIALKPTKSIYYLGLARAYRSKLDTTRAVELFKQAISLDMYNRQAYISLANTLSSQGKHEEAKELLEKCMTISPRYLEVYNILGLHYRRIKDYKTSIFYFEKSLAIQEKANTLRNYTITLFLSKNYEKALEIAQKALIGSKSAYSYAILGVAYFGVGNKEKYVENIRIAAKKKYNFDNFADDMQFIRKDTAFLRAVKEVKALVKKGKEQEVND